MRFDFITPQSVDELEQYLDDLQFLSQWATTDKLTYFDWVKWAVPQLTIVYTPKTEKHPNGILIGCFVLLLYKRTAELHGIFRQDFRQYKELKHIGSAIASQIIKDVFTRFNKKTLITKVPLDEKLSRPVRGFLIRNKFKLLQKDNEQLVYKLTKDRYLNGSRQQEA